MNLSDEIMNEVGNKVMKLFRKQALTDVVKAEMLAKAKDEVMKKLSSMPETVVESSMKGWFERNIVTIMAPANSANDAK